MLRKKLVLICLAAVVLCVAGIALAKAVKVELVPCPINYPGPDLPPGSGFVIFNNSAGAV